MHVRDSREVVLVGFSVSLFLLLIQLFNFTSFSVEMIEQMLGSHQLMFTSVYTGAVSVRAAT